MPAVPPSLALSVGRSVCMRFCWFRVLLDGRSLRWPLVAISSGCPAAGAGAPRPRSLSEGLECVSAQRAPAAVSLWHRFFAGRLRRRLFPSSLFRVGVYLVLLPVFRRGCVRGRLERSRDCWSLATSIARRRCLSAAESVGCGAAWRSLGGPSDVGSGPGRKESQWALRGVLCRR